MELFLFLLFCVSIRPPPFGRGKHCCRNGDINHVCVSIRPPPFGRGKPTTVSDAVNADWFQSAPRLSEGGNVGRLGLLPATPSFNPPPAFRKGETNYRRHVIASDSVSIRPPPFGRGKPGGDPRPAAVVLVSIRPPPFGRGKLRMFGEEIIDRVVSIRPPPFGRGKRVRAAGPAACQDVSIRPPPFGRGKRLRFVVEVPATVFQSAPRLSEGGNDFILIGTGKHDRFNPPPAFRKGETCNLQIVDLHAEVSIRPPPFGRGKQCGLRGKHWRRLFQSAPRLSEGGNHWPSSF